MATKAAPAKLTSAQEKRKAVADKEKENKVSNKMAKVGHRDQLDELEKRLEELRKRFDMYFHGSNEQRMPPYAPKEQLGGELRRIREDELKTWNTVDKFRFAQLFARYVSLDRMWARTLKQIEEGTYKRDKMKVELRKKKDEEQQQRMAEEMGGAPAPMDTQIGRRPQDSLDGMDVDVGSFDDENLISSRPPSRPLDSTSGAAARAPGAPAPVSGFGKAVPAPIDGAPLAASASSSSHSRPQPRPHGSSNGGGGGGGGSMNDQRLKQLYDVYMQAKKRTGESSSLTMEGLKQQIEKQIPAIKAKHKCENVDFKVVLKDGKAMLKAVPK